MLIYRLLEKAESYTVKSPTFSYTHSEPNVEHTNHGYIINQQDNLPFNREEFHNTLTGSATNLNGLETVISDSGSWSGDDYEVEAPRALDRVSVKFKDDKNVTIEITPRNQGHKVKNMTTPGFKGKVQKPVKKFEHTNDMNKFKEEVVDLCSAISVSAAGPKARNSGVANSKSESETTVKPGFVGGKHILTSKRPSSAQVGRGKDKRFDRILGSSRPASATAASRQPIRKERVITQVVVDFGDIEEKKEEKKEKKPLSRNFREKDIITAVQQAQFSDDEIKDDWVEEDDNDSDVEITSELLRPETPTKCVSEPEKNYYEIARHSSASQMHIVSNAEVIDRVKDNPIIKTTKTIEFDQRGVPRETTKTSVLDTQLLQVKEKQIVSHDEMEVIKQRSRPSSAVVSGLIS